uniref:Tetraspanin n=1 Tax=Glossina morsitans morsitans TaxID=37546 RepID=A0A1B0FJP2_GLOMM
MDLVGRTFSDFVRRLSLKHLNLLIVSAIFILFRLTFDLFIAVCAVSAMLFAVVAVYYYLNWNRRNRQYMFTSKIMFLTIFAVMLFGTCCACILLRRTLRDMFKIAFENKEETFASKFIDYVQETYYCCGWNSVEDYLDEPIPKSCINRNPCHGICAVGCKNKILF